MFCNYILTFKRKNLSSQDEEIETENPKTLLPFTFKSSTLAKEGSASYFLR